jgi:hypothetical protein
MNGKPRRFTQNPLAGGHVELPELNHSGAEDLEACESRLDVAEKDHQKDEKEGERQKDEKEETQGAAHCHLHDDVQRTRLGRVVLAWAFMW